MNESQLAFALKTSRRIVKRMIDDITEDESMQSISGQGNHIRWQVGHLAYFGGLSLALLGDDSEPYQDLKETCGMGSEVTDDAAAYPSWRDLRDRLYRIQDKLISYVEGASEDELTRKIGESDGKYPAWEMLSFTSVHEAYHAGQIVPVRRALGRQRPFG